MPAVSKLRLSFLLLFLQLLVYLYVVPKGTQGDSERTPVEEAVDPGFPLEEHCRTSYPRLAGICIAGCTYFQELADNCGIRVHLPEPKDTHAPLEEQIDDPHDNITTVPVQNITEQLLSNEVINNQEKKSVEGETSGPEKSSLLIYQVIVVLLFLSVSFALADCFQERAKKKANNVSTHEAIFLRK